MSRSLAQILNELAIHGDAVRRLAAEAKARMLSEHEALFGNDEPAPAPVPAPPAPPPPIPVAPPPPAPPAPATPVEHGSAVENVLALVASDAAHPGTRDDDGRLVLTQYAGPTDRTPDANSSAGIGNRDNKLTPLSISISRDLVAALGLRGGEMIMVAVDGREYPLGTYDDTTAKRITNTIDVYDPGDKLGRDTFLVTIPAGRWRLRAKGAAKPGPAPRELTRAVKLSRARSMLGEKVEYKLGAQPHLADWSALAGSESDCSGFVDATNGIDRNATGENTDAMVADARGAQRYYRLVTGPAIPGDDYVYPSPGAGHYGHTGVIVAVDEHGVPTRVIDCSSGNPDGRAVQERDPKVFVDHGAIIVRAVAFGD